MFERIPQVALIAAILVTLTGTIVALPAVSEEAKALLDEAVAFYKENGREKTFAEINNPKGKLTRGELYIFVYDKDGRVAAHGADLKQIGRDVMEIQDEKGKFFGREIMRVESGGSVDYLWTNPETGAVEPKTSYIVVVDGYRFGCGIYR